MFPASNLFDSCGSLQVNDSGQPSSDGSVMRRVIAYILVGVGVFGIVLAPLMRFVVYPKVQQFPLDQNFTDYASGQGTYLDFTDFKIKGPAELTVCRTAYGDVKAGIDTGAAVWDVVTYIHVPGQIICGGADQAYNITSERWAFNRKTVQAENVAGAHPDFGKTNAYLVFPFNVDTTQTYNYWDATAAAAFPATYKGEETVQGRTLYKFVSVVPPTKVQEGQPLGSVVGGDPNGKYDVYYANPDSVALVDPLTGIIVSGSSHLILTARLQGESTDAGTILDVQLKERADSVKKLTDLAIENGNKLTMISTTIPLVSLIGGLLLVGLGVWLGLGADGSRPRRHAGGSAAPTSSASATSEPA